MFLKLNVQQSPRDFVHVCPENYSALEILPRNKFERSRTTLFLKFNLELSSRDLVYVCPENYSVLEI